MIEKRVLLVCDDFERSEDLSIKIQANLQRCTLQAVTSFEILDYAALAGVGLLLIDVRTVSGLGSLLERCEELGATIPVVALDDTYDDGVALALFRRGVTDYLSLHDHLGQFQAIFEALGCLETRIGDQGFRPMVAGVLSLS
jgi:FixJ family two-component response regulator